MNIETRAVESLTPAEYNPRTISKRALEGLRESIRRFGLVEPIIVNDRTGHVVGGHQRLKVLESEGTQTTQVVVVDMPEAEERALNVALNHRNIQGEWDPAAARDVLDKIEAEMPDIFAAIDLNSLSEEVDKILAQAEQVDIEQDEVPEPPEEPVSQLGDLYLLGNHRLICGDSTDASVVERLLAQQRPPLIMVTDPPYGVEYAPGWRDEADLNESDGRMFKAKRVGDKIQNDDRADWSEAFALFPGDVAYTWTPSGDNMVVTGGALHAAGFQIRATIIWRKQHFTISRGAYHYQHEPCWYAVRKGRKAHWVGDRTQSTVWDISSMSPLGGRKEERVDHGTQKPVECMARPIRNHGGKKDSVYDPFLGSGTTLIAAEQLGRVCYGVELDPRYVDVTVARWERLTGKTAERA